MVTNGFSSEPPPLDTKPAEATVNAIQDGTTQLTLNPNPISTDTANALTPVPVENTPPQQVAAQPTSEVSSIPTDNPSAPATQAPSENASSQLVAAQPTSEISPTSTDSSSTPITLIESTLTQPVA